MIQVYSPSNSNLDTNGDAVLMPTSCIAHFEINGEWSVKLIHPIDDRSKFIVEDTIVKVPSPFGDLCYLITDVDRSDYDVQAVAYPIATIMAKGDVPFLVDTRAVNMTGQQVLDTILKNSSYVGESNITKTSTAYWQKMNAIEAIASSSDNSFLNRWGGEILWLNKKIVVNERLGSDHGSRAEFGFNLNGIREKIDMSGIVTRIYPQAYNGHMLPDGEAVDSPHIKSFRSVYPSVIEYSDIKLKEDASDDDVENGVTVCDTLDALYKALRERARKEFENGIDLPLINYEVNMIDLAHVDAYKDFKNLVEVQLGDTVHVKHRRLGISTKTRVKSLDYDCILKKVDTLELGDAEVRYFDEANRNQQQIQQTLNNVVDPNSNTLIANKVRGILNASQTSLRAQKDIANKQDVRAILFEDLDPKSPTFGAMCLGTQGIQIAKKRNATNTDWTWGTAITFESVIADYIITGTLSDKLGNNYMDLDKGEMVINKGTFKDTINTIKDANVGGFICLDYDHTGKFPYSGVVLGKRSADGTFPANHPMIRMKAFGDGGNTSMISLNTNTNKNAQVLISDDSSLGSTLSVTADRFSMNGKQGLTGTYTVKESLTVEKGLVVGVK